MLHGGLEGCEWWEGDHYAHLCILQEYISLILIGFPISSRRPGSALPETLSDQRAAEILSLQELLANRRPSEVAHDARVWSGPRFTARVAYRLCQDQEDPLLQR